MAVRKLNEPSRRGDNGEPIPSCRRSNISIIILNQKKSQNLKFVTQCIPLVDYRIPL